MRRGKRIPAEGVAPEIYSQVGQAMTENKPSAEAMEAEAKKVFHEAKYADENPGGDPVAIITEAIQYAVHRAVEEERERWTQGCPDSCAMAEKLRYEDASVELRINAAVEAERERIKPLLSLTYGAMIERRGYANIWEYKYGKTWSEEDAQIEAALNGKEATDD